MLAAALNYLAAEMAKGIWKKQGGVFPGPIREMINAPALAFADFSVSLEVDASHSGLGAFLLKEQEISVRLIVCAR